MRDDRGFLDALVGDGRPLLILSAIFLIASFLSYLGYLYLDSWHSAATLVLLPPFVGGILHSRDLVSISMPPHPFDVRSRTGLGRALLLLASVGIAIAGTAGFAAALGIHPVIGYLSLTPLAPAVLGMLVFAGGLVLAIAGTLFARP